MNRPADDGLADSVQTARTLFDIVDRIADSEGASLSELAQELDYAKSTVHRHLRTLEDLGYVVERDGDYHVGLRFLELGVTARKSYDGYKLVREKAEEIAEETGERAQFFVVEHGKAVYLARSVGEHAVRTDPGIGSRIPVYAASAGKAILSQLPEPELSDMFEQLSFEPVTEHTITDPEELRAELEAVRERGYAFNREESLRGTHAVCVPICGPEATSSAASASPGRATA